MMAPFMPARCFPPDFINPFPPLFMTAAVCSVLLLLQVLVLFLTFKGAPAALPRRWQNRALRLILLLSAGATVGAGGFTFWVWLQSRSFIPWCVPVPPRVAAQEAAYQAAQGGVMITVLVTALLLLAGLAMVLLRRWQRRGPTPAGEDASAASG